MCAPLTVLAALAVVAGFAVAGAVPGVAAPRVALQALTLLRAARPKHPFGARCRGRKELVSPRERGRNLPRRLESKGNHEDRRTQVAEAAVQARIAQTRSVNPMAVTPVGTVALFPAVLPKKSLGAP